MQIVHAAEAIPAGAPLRVTDTSPAGPLVVVANTFTEDVHGVAARAIAAEARGWMSTGGMARVFVGNTVVAPGDPLTDGGDGYFGNAGSIVFGTILAAKDADNRAPAWLEDMESIGEPGGGGSMEFYVWDNEGFAHGEQPFDSNGGEMYLPIDTHTDALISPVPDGWTVETDGQGQGLTVPAGAYAVTFDIQPYLTGLTALNILATNVANTQIYGIIRGAPATAIAGSCAGVIPCDDDARIFCRFIASGSDETIGRMTVVRLGGIDAWIPAP